ncbi:MAG: YlbF family regulator [Bacilli bacterium]
MNKEIKDNIDNLKSELMNDPTILEFLDLKKEVENDRVLKNLRNKIQFLKDCKMNDEQKNNYNKLLDEYNKNPLVINYKRAEENAYDLLNEIKDNLEL